MIIFNGFDIKIHKGDYAGFSLFFTGDDLPENGTQVAVRIKKSPYYKNVVLEKVLPIVDGFLTVNFEPEDTENLDYGKYIWNLKIMYANGQEPWTVFEKAPNFEILPKDGA